MLFEEAFMDVREAVATRFSCRAFLPAPVPEAIVRDILERARQAPSGGNLQPWYVDVLAGEPLAHLKTRLAPRMATELPRGEGEDYAIYPTPLKQPYDARRRQVGEMLYNSIGVPREDRPGRYRQYARNFVLFDAPVAMFFSVDRTLGPPQWSDLGMFIQTVMLLARGHGLHSCAQEAWTFFHKTLAEVLPIPPERILFCGMGLGHADMATPVNGWRSPRVPLAEFATLRGF